MWILEKIEDERRKSQQRYDRPTSFLQITLSFDYLFEGKNLDVLFCKINIFLFRDSKQA
jgi:hypothetical protein